jgi:hypothetical protein
MAILKNLATGLCLVSLLWPAALAAPVAEAIKGVELEKRYAGESPGNPIMAYFNVGSWPNIAEENCYAMLCLNRGILV